VQEPPVQDPPPVVVPDPDPVLVPLPPPVVVVLPPEDPPPSLPSATAPDPIIEKSPDDPLMTMPGGRDPIDLTVGWTVMAEPVVL
jgi:hypothetical protein